MPYLDEMQTLAQIAIGVAGFAGIVIAVRPADMEGSNAGGYVRMRELVLASLGVVFFAFLPSLSVGVFGEGPSSWQGPQLLFGAYQALLMSLFFGTIGSGGVSRLEWVLTPIGVVVIAAQLATGVGYFGDYLEETYFFALLWLLFIAAFDFAVVILRRDAA